MWFSSVLFAVVPVSVHPYGTIHNGMQFLPILNIKISVHWSEDLPISTSDPLLKFHSMAFAVIQYLSQAWEHVYESYPWISIISLRLLIAFVLLFWLREQIRPPYKNEVKMEEIPLAPEPSGHPIIGNLLRLGQARDDVDHKFVSNNSQCAFYHILTQ